MLVVVLIETSASDILHNCNIQTSRFKLYIKTSDVMFFFEIKS
jgi:hypothetical protein